MSYPISPPIVGDKLVLTISDKDYQNAFQVHPESGRGVQQSRSRQGTDRSPPNDVRASQPVYQRQKREADLQHRAETPLQGKSKQPNPCFAWDSNLRPQDL